ncbi:MAG: dehydrogenase/oxidoreductase [Chitinophagales bacterium]|nr:MAG: dehydrogenase/oxidoreductase [Chitinophagales bacterium]
MSDNFTESDVLIIGAGPSGTVAASLIKQAGFQVQIVEKQRFPRFVIGESLLPKCMEGLQEAGFIPALEKRGFQKKYGAKFVKGKEICDFNFEDQYSSGWSWTWQVPRADFDKTLADEVERMGVPVAYETEVTHIQFNGTHTVTTIQQPEGVKTIKARFIIDASGYGRVIPRLLHLDRPSSFPVRKALFTHVEDVHRSLADEPNRITVVVHADSVWIWIIPFSNGITSVGIVALPEFFESFRGTPTDQMRAILTRESLTAKRFENAPFLFEPRVMQGWSTTTDKFYGNGYVLVGNVTEFLDPIFSSGVTLAVESARRAAHLVCDFLAGRNVDWENSYMKPVMAGIDVFRSYVMSWYDGTLFPIFFAEHPNPMVKKQICSVLAGHVWDETNPYVKHHDTALQRLARAIRAMKVINSPIDS